MSISLTTFMHFIPMIAIIWTCTLVIWGASLSVWMRSLRRADVERNGVRQSDVWNMRVIWGMGTVVIFATSMMPDLALIINTFHTMILINYTSVLHAWSNVIVAKVQAATTSLTL